MTDRNVSSPSSDTELPTNDGDNEVSLISLLTLLLRRRATIVWSSILCAALFTGYSLIGDRTWTTATSFFPQGKKAGGNLSALAAQFGVGVSGSDANESPNFYADLVKSRAILTTVVDSSVPRVDIADAFKIKLTDPTLRRDMAIKSLNNAITVSTNAKTGVVTMRVSTRSAPLSANISTQLLDLLNRFNQNTRRGQASAEREFTEGRLAVVKKELRAAEDERSRFLQNNKVITSAQLQVEQERLDSEVRLQRELYTNLAKSFEQAKIDEVRDTPVITVVERPEISARPDTRGIATKGVVSLIAGFVLGIILALVFEGFTSEPGSRSAAQVEFSRLGRATLRDFRRPWRLLRSVKA
ncbi:MAG: Wzz/FepE/Etk N-terminal domain-containing protein [Gemmatimonas sp.]